MAVVGVWIGQLLGVQAADTFTFAGYTFNQLYTPDRGALLGTNMLLGGAQFSAGLPASVTSPINFPGGSGFNSALCLGPLTGLSTNSIRAVNLPLGNDGSSTRHGIEVYWSNGRVLRNESGVDLVIYESGSTSSAVEGVMARVRYNATNWSDWFYYAPDQFQITTGLEGLFSYSFEFTEMGIPSNAPVDRIQLANLTLTDRILTLTPQNLGNGLFVGEGKVVFDGSTNIKPDPGAFSSTNVFTSTTVDPDPLYVASLHEACELVSPALTVAASNSVITLSWPGPSCYSIQATTNLAGTNTIWTTPPETTVVSSNRQTVTISSATANRFFRLIK
jgi:hypothetical protein